MGYGSRALQALNSFYSGEYFNLDESTPAEPEYPDPTAIDPVCPSLLLLYLF
jgi:N-acetyltransferase 10